MTKYFITGTDTEVGKTFTCAVLTAALNACYWKPINSGESDRDFIQQLTGLSDEHFSPTNYLLKAPLAPDQSAKLENITIDLNNCVMPNTHKKLLVEGAGGVYAPLTENECVMDLIKKLDLPVVIVSRAKIGTINHTLLTIEALRRRNIDIYGVIFNGDINPESKAAIERWGNVRTLFQIPFFENLTQTQFLAWIEQNKNRIAENFA